MKCISGGKTYTLQKLHKSPSIPFPSNLTGSKTNQHKTMIKCNLLGQSTLHTYLFNSAHALLSTRGSHQSKCNYLCIYQKIVLLWSFSQVHSFADKYLASHADRLLT